MLFLRPLQKSVLSIVLGSSLFATAASAAPSAPSFKNDEDKVSYIIGHQIADSLKNDDLKINKKMLIKSLEDGLNGQESAIAQKDAQEFMQKYMSGQQKMRGDKNLKEGEAFLAKNKKEPGVVTLPSGLQYKIITAGTGPKPKENDTVTVNYEGTLINGKIFDSSYQRGQPVSFPVAGVIKGWVEALQMMPEGSTWMLYVPAALAYGDKSPSPHIGPNSTLIFKVNLVSIAKPANKPAAAPTAPAKK